MNESVLDTLVEVTLPTQESFLKICETLTRIGVSSKSEPRLYQTCHILHKRGHYYIPHFKEMLALDGNPTTFDEEDRQRRNKIIALLEQWRLLAVCKPDMIRDQCDISKIKIIPHSEKKNWQLIKKYSIGKK